MKIHDIPPQVSRFVTGTLTPSKNVRASVRQKALAWKRSRSTRQFVPPPVSPSVQASVAIPSSNPTSALADKETWDTQKRAMHEAQLSFMASLAPGVWQHAVRVCRLRLWHEKGITDMRQACDAAYRMLVAERYRFAFLPRVTIPPTPAKNAQELPIVRPAIAATVLNALPSGKQPTGPFRPLRLVCPIEPCTTPVEVSEDTGETGRYPAIVALLHSKVG